MEGRNELGHFEKGNTFGIGKPPMYETPESLEEKVIEYFIWIAGEYEERTGERTITTGKGDNETTTTETYPVMFEIRPKEIPSVTGLAKFLGFESRQSMYDYLKKDGFSYPIKRALLEVENNYESGLWSDKPTGVIFALKNMGWADRQEHDHTTKGESMNVINLGAGIRPDESTD